MASPTIDRRGGRAGGASGAGGRGSPRVRGGGGERRRDTQGRTAAMASPTIDRRRRRAVVASVAGVRSSTVGAGGGAQMLPRRAWRRRLRARATRTYAAAVGARSGDVAR